MSPKHFHNKWKTPKIELPLRHLPRFKEPAEFVMHATIPGQQGKEAEMDFNTTGAKAEDFLWKAKNVKVNPEEDVKISFTFANNKLLIPWLSVFDAKKRRSLEKLEVTFEHDQYDILEVRYNRVYGREIQRLDASHPSVVGFVMVYQWVHADETDFSSGIFEMFLMSLICGFVMISMVLCYNGDVQPRVQSKRTQATRSSGNRDGISPSVIVVKMCHVCLYSLLQIFVVTDISLNFHNRQPTADSRQPINYLCLFSHVT